MPTASSQALRRDGDSTGCRHEDSNANAQSSAHLAPGVGNADANPDSHVTRNDGVFHAVSGTIPFVVDGGDLNRSGSDAVEGEAVVIDVPPDRAFAGGAVVYLSIPETEFDLDWDFSESGKATFLPSVPPGGYWLESTAADYHRTWSNVAFFFASYFPEDTPQAADLPYHEAIVVVPPGTVGQVAGLKAFSRSSGTRRLSPGTWRINVSAAGGLSSTRVLDGR